MLNILFYYNSDFDPITGGVGRVSNVLAEYFESKGHQVFFLSKDKSATYKDKRQFFLLDGKEYHSDDNINYFLQFLKKYNIDILINQSAMSREASKLAYHATELNIPVLSVIHNSLIGSIENFSAVYFNRFKKIHLHKLLSLTDNKIIKKFILSIYKFKYLNHYKELCKNSSKVILLSNSFFSEIEFFTGSGYEDKLVAIPNPVSFEGENDGMNTFDKKKELLYVGVVNFFHKRVDLLLQIWVKISDKYPEWSLKIVGGGVDLEEAKKMSSDLELKNITFTGFQNPQEFYKNASIFCMTSSSEGFGIVLVEAMQHGVVPVAFNSYLSIEDIIDTNKNGILVDSFDIEKYAQELSKLMDNDEYRINLAQAAIQKSKKFSKEAIGERWEALFAEVKN